MQKGIIAKLPEQLSPHHMSLNSIADYVQWEQERGASENALRRCRGFTNALYHWLPEDKLLSKDTLLAWRKSLQAKGYSPETELNYIKGINRYLDYIGRSDLRFNRGKPKDITGKQFGYLTAMESTGEKSRRDCIWRCRCKCGNVVDLPATRLLTGNTLSCGCLLGEHLKRTNKYFAGTSLRQSVEERVISTRSSSGYTGVTAKRGKWLAYIKYKGQHYSLGSYTQLEDAVKARARAKQLVQEDAQGLLDFYDALHRNDPERPNRSNIREMHKEPAAEPKAVSGSGALRSNNSSGHAGVYQRKTGWSAKITYQKKTYQLGHFTDKASAIAARLEAERRLAADPIQFLEQYENRQKEK